MLKKLHIYGYKNNESIFIAEIFYIWALATINCYKNQVAWGQTSLKKPLKFITFVMSGACFRRDLFFIYYFFARNEDWTY